MNTLIGKLMELIDIIIYKKIFYVFKKIIGLRRKLKRFIYVLNFGIQAEVILEMI